MGFILKLRKILGKIADVFIKGREAGLWEKNNGPNVSGPSDTFRGGNQ